MYLIGLIHIYASIYFDTKECVGKTEALYEHIIITIHYSIIVSACLPKGIGIEHFGHWTSYPSEPVC